MKDKDLFNLVGIFQLILRTGSGGRICMFTGVVATSILTAENALIRAGLLMT